MRIRVSVVALAISLAANAFAQDAATVARVLEQRCVMCHQGDAAPLGLRLDSVDALLKGGSKGSVVRPGDPAGSELIRRIRGQSLPRMPLTGPPFLSEEESTAFERWIAAGAPRTTAAAPASAPRVRAPGEPLTYTDVQPILGARCAKCHAAQGQMGAAPEGYLLNNYENTLAHADRARVVPGHPAASELVRRIHGQSTPRMPFDGPPFLSRAEIALVERWIEQGARDAQGRPAPVPAGARVRLRGTIGSHAELRGTVGPDGGILAERVRSR